MDPVTSLRDQGIVMVQAIIYTTFRGNNFPVTLSNISDQDVKLPRGLTVALASTIERFFMG